MAPLAPLATPMLCFLFNECYCSLLGIGKHRRSQGDQQAMASSPQNFHLQV